MFPLPILLIKFIIKPIIDVREISMYLLCSKSIEQFFFKCAKISNEIKQSQLYGCHLRLLQLLLCQSTMEISVNFNAFPLSFFFSFLKKKNNNKK